MKVCQLNNLQESCDSSDGDLRRDLHWFSPAHLLLLVQLKAETVLSGGIHV